MNRVFLSGTVKEKARLFYTPEGERMWEFLFHTDDGDFDIGVLYREKDRKGQMGNIEGEKLIIIGMLSLRGKNQYVINAKNIVFMED